MKTIMSIGDTVKELRQEKGYSQKQLAKALNVSPGCLSKYETGKCQIPTDILIGIADTLGVSLDYIVGRNRLQFDYTCLNENFTGNIKTGTVLSDALSLPRSDRVIFYEVLIALKCKQNAKNAKYK